MSQKPSQGRIVLYRLDQNDVLLIEEERKRTGHRGNHVHRGQEFPMVIITVHGDQPDSYVNGKVLLDGTDDLWATSVQVGEGPRTFSWPARS